MVLTEELMHSARHFGEALRSTDAVQVYLVAEACLLADAEARDLDRDTQATFEVLLARQRAGEQLQRDELDAFYALRRQAQAHPLIAAHDVALSGVKTAFASLGYELGLALGVDYTTLARAD